jgi:hypothetical protein
MHAPATDPTKNMAIKAHVSDEATGTPVTFDLIDVPERSYR